MSATWRRVVVAAIVAIATIANAWTLDRKNLWLDESVSWHMATTSTSQLIADTADDIHPPGYYLALKAWIDVWGDSLWALRSLSLAATVVSMLLAARLAMGALPFSVACAVLLWFGLSPHTIAYSQETRMYAMATTAVLAMVVAYRAWIDSNGRRTSALVGYACAATLALYLHYFTAFAIVAIWLHALLIAIGRYDVAGARASVPWRAWLVANAGVALAFSPWLAVAFRQAKAGQPWRLPVPLARLPGVAWWDFRSAIFGTYGTPSMASLAWIVPTMLLLVGVGMAIVFAWRDRRAERAACFVLLTLVPVAIGLALLPVEGELDLSRYVGYVTPLFMIAATMGVVARSRRSSRAVAAVVFVAVFSGLPSLRAYYADPVKDYDARPLVAYLSDHARHASGAAQDAIVVAPGYVAGVLRFVSRATLAYQPVYSDDDLRRTLEDDRARGLKVWIVADYRWPGFDHLGDDGHMARVPTPWLPADRLRVFVATAGR